MTLPFDGPLLVATHNAGKLDEMRALLAPLGVTVEGARDHNLPEPDETGTTFVENARIKAHAAAQATGRTALADDSGIVIDALDGQPGVYTADWATTAEGTRDFTMAMTRAHDLLLASGVPEPWTCRFCATLVLARPDGTDQVFEGAVPGTFSWPPRGEIGHGYDPIFVPDGHDLTFGQMSTDQKNTLSHRARALQALIAALS